MSEFEEALRAEALQHKSEWTAERDHMAADVDRRSRQLAENAEGVQRFLEAMAAAGCRPRRWGVRTRTLDNKTHRQRPITGWVFEAGGRPCFVNKSGSLYTLTGSKQPGRGRGMLYHPVPADRSTASFVEGLERLRLSVTTDADRSGGTDRAT